jgi:NADH dehydrogenase [ubiquinone] 1 alpha subcomplex assembly factor 1
MVSQTTSACLVILCLLLGGTTMVATDGYRVLFDFSNPEFAGEWEAVNDGVMGGVSDGRFRISAERTLEFFGTLSLENNGGFASVRTRQRNLALKKGEVLVARVRGDGREYSLNLYTSRQQTAFSYRARFATKKGDWIEVRIPLDKFVATSYGQVVPNRPLDPNEVNGLGILLGDKQAGQFKLEIDWIRVVKAE